MTFIKVRPLNVGELIVDKNGGVTQNFNLLWQQLVGSADDLLANSQVADGDLTAVAALTGTGIAVRTADDTWALRSLSAPAAGLSITNPSGVAGNPTFALANDLAALEALSGTNTIYYRSASDTWSAVTIGAGLSFTTGTLSATAVGLTDGDKGDITVSSTGTAWAIDNDAVTYAKMQNVSAASKLLGRGSASGSGDVEEITLGTGLSMSGTTLNGTGGYRPLVNGDNPPVFIINDDFDLIMGEI